MLTDLFVVGSLAVAMLGLVEAAGRLERRGGPRWDAERAVREAMRGPEAASVRAEFRRSGICAPERGRPPGFL